MPSIKMTLTPDDSMPATDKHRGRSGDRVSSIHETRQVHKDISKPRKWANQEQQKRKKQRKIHRDRFEKQRLGCMM